ncbi:MAG: ribonuclease P protein component [Candidatus Uhrbacteria bacterium]|nr:ribonuclease P protein component [Candidatus Uhrbacteria bacterium]
MLAREQRLSEKRDFQALFSRGMYLSTPLYTLRWRRNFGACSRFGFVVANTISKKATQRNTIRRRFRECVRRNIEAFPYSADVAVIVRPKALGAPSKEIEAELLKSFTVIRQRGDDGQFRPRTARPTRTQPSRCARTPRV